MQILIGKTILGAFRLQALDEIAIRFNEAEWSCKMLERQNVRRLPAAMRGAEQDVKVRAVAFSQRFVSPRVGGTPAIKTDMRRDRPLWRGGDLSIEQSRTARGAKKTFELRF